MKFTYMKTPLYRMTFSNRRIREWVENEIAEYYLVLNLFAGETRLKCKEEIRVDIRKEMDASYTMDALDFIIDWEKGVACQTKPRFGAVILDPPYSYRKSMTKYGGAVSSPLNQIKKYLPYVLTPNGIVITFGYHSNVMGEGRGFKQEHILLMSHGGAIHDTIAVVERKV